MKIKELKHNHSLTDLLKVLLFSILMLAPILAIGVKCAYVVINKNAKDSYSGTNTIIEYVPQYQTNELNNNNDFIVGNYYYGQFEIVPSNEQTSISILDPGDNGTNSIRLITYNVNGQNTIFYTEESNIKDYDFFDVYLTYDNTGENELTSFVSADDQDDNYSFHISTYFKNKTDTIYFNFIFQYIHEDTFNENILDYVSIVPSDLQHYEIEQTQTTGTLDNVFYYAIDEIAQEPLFNWTQNTAIYTGVNAMCTGMEITSPIIPILITYWFLLTCIYVIIDILIKGFTMLTHLIGSKLA